MKIGERTVNNALFNTVSGVIPLILSFVFWPYIVDKLGDASYGIFALVTTVIGYFSLLDLGLGNAVVKYVAQYAGRDHDHTESIIGTAMTVFLIAGMLGVLLILSIARMLATKWLKVPQELIDIAFYSFCAASLGFFMTILLTLFTAIINGLSRYDISGSAMAVMGVTTTIGSVLLLRAGFGLLHLVWLNILIPFIVVLFYVLMVRRLMPGISLRLRLRISTLKEILHFGMFAMLSRLTDVISNQVNLLVIGAILGVASVTYYVIPFTILSRLTNLLCRIGMVIFPAISELQGQQRHDTIRELYLTTSRIIFSFATAFMLPLLIFGVHFLRLWMDPEFAQRGGPVLQIITVGVFLSLCTNVPTFVVNGLGHPKISGLAAVSTALLFFILMLPGAFWGGIIGVAAAQLISAAVIAPLFIRYVNCRVLHLPLRMLLGEAYARPLLAAAVAAVPMLLVPQGRIESLLVLLAVMGAGMCFYFFVALLLGVYQERERRVLMEYIQRKWNSLRRKSVL
ncbi:oligosaccharide flippase family protein [Tichowtungia aerotolerans]|uniref:Oligosaccharide flippase family protein n=1 Tax=Tichowtungia aerotolerans TaxID=2697043 RepID=A0A6P1M8R9_9BACT|nr:oligosaccharide flippase family protein [Tichowtungia aerotolerans]QHI70281.1 oligosaccharide flippase family protein [Tichowtungia aerotolerans]